MSHVRINQAAVSRWNHQGFELCRTYERVTSPTWMSHATPTNDPHERVMSHLRMTHMNESCHTHEWVKQLLSRMNPRDALCWKYKSVWVMLHMWISHAVTHSKQSCHTPTTQSSCDVASELPRYQVLSRVRISYVAHTSKSYGWMIYVTFRNESCRTYQ